MNKKKYRIEIPVDYVVGHLRYGHFEGIVELTDKELKEIASGSITPKEIVCEGNLNLIIDDYSVDDYGDFGNPIIEEIKNV